MSLAIVLGGLTILVGLAALIGYLDGRARRAAWRRLVQDRPTRPHASSSDRR